jgi:hypothetical protein
LALRTYALYNESKLVLSVLLTILAVSVFLKSLSLD